MSRKLTRFMIHLDSETLLYFPGSFLTGAVVLEVEDETPALALDFQIIGEGVVLVAERGRLSYNDRENYIDFKMRLLGPTSGASEVGSVMEDDMSTFEAGQIMILEPGVHTFPFKLGLPLGLPSTFLGKHGWVQYYCKVSLRDPSGTLHKNQQVFIVMNPIDLSLEPQSILEPVEVEMEEKAGSCSSGTVFARVMTDRGAYVPGECIKIGAFIENMSRSMLINSKATLYETIIYYSKGRVKEREVRELASVEGGDKIGPKSVSEWRGKTLMIPPLPPTNLRGCHLIKIYYDLVFSMEKKSTFSAKIMKVQLPIVLATYPTRNPDGTLKRKKGSYFPTTLPVTRPWNETLKPKKK